MLSDSVLGVLYRWWRCSFVYALLGRIYRWWSNAWDHSLIHRMLAHPSRIQAAYEASAYARLVRCVLEGFARGFGRLWAWLGRVNAGSLNQRFWKRFCAGSAVLKYDFLFGAFLAGMFVCPHDIWSNTYALAAAVFFLIFYLMRCGALGRKPYDPAAFGLGFPLFFLACLLSLGFTRSFGDSLRVLSFFITAFLLCYLAAATLRDRRSLMTVLGLLYAAVILTACYAILQRMMGVAVSSSLTDLTLNKGVPGRVYATLDNPNNYAEFLVLATPLAAVFAIQTRRRPVWCLILCCGLGLPMLALVMTYSRSCWIAMALTALVFLYFSNKRLIPLLFLAAVLAIPFLPASVMTRLSTLVNSHDSSSNYRVHLWRGVYLLLKDHGLTGIGLGPESFAEVYPQYARAVAKVGAPHSHMVWMELLVETGVFGFVSFLWFFLRIIKNGACALARTRGLGARRLCLCGGLSAMLGIAFSCCVEYVWYYPRVLFMFFLVCGVVAGMTDRPDGDFEPSETLAI